MEINSYILKPGHEMIPFKTYADFVNVNDIGKLAINITVNDIASLTAFQAVSNPPPNKIKIKRMYNDYLMFSIVTDKERKIIINKNEIFGILLKKAKDFFSSISVLKDYKDGSLKEIERAEKIAGDTLEADYNREY